MDPLSELISEFDASRPNFRPTELFNESWLLKLVLKLAASQAPDGFPLSFAPGASWFSEALLPTAFKERYRGDRLAESRTNADGVIGHFKIGIRGKADLSLLPDARQLVIVEAKIHSPLSPRTLNAPGFDQAARNVACIAEVLRIANRAPDEALQLGFTVLAPAHSLTTLSPLIDSDSIRAKVSARVSQYQGQLGTWKDLWFTPTLDRVRLTATSWEEAIDWVTRDRLPFREALRAFYMRCLEFN